MKYRVLGHTHFHAHIKVEVSGSVINKRTITVESVVIKVEHCQFHLAEVLGMQTKLLAVKRIHLDVFLGAMICILIRRLGQKLSVRSNISVYVHKGVHQVNLRIRMTR